MLEGKTFHTAASITVRTAVWWTNPSWLYVPLLFRDTHLSLLLINRLPACFREAVLTVIRAEILCVTAIRFFQTGLQRESQSQKGHQPLSTQAQTYSHSPAPLQKAHERKMGLSLSRAGNKGRRIQDQTGVIRRPFRSKWRVDEGIFR